MGEYGRRVLGPFHYREGPKTPVPNKASTNINPHSSSTASSSRKEAGVTGRATQHARQRGSGNSKRTRSRLLFPFVCSNKEIRGMEACYRSQEVKQIDRLPTLQNGDSSFDQSSALSGRMGRTDRPIRRILSPLSSSQIQKVSQSPCPGNYFPIQSNVLRIMHSSPDLHQSDEVHCSVSKRTVNPHTHVPRRLVDSSIMSRKTPVGRPSRPRPGFKVGLSDKLEEVRFDPNTTIQVSGHADKSEDRGGSSISGESRESQSLVSLPAAISSDHSQRLSQFPRHSESRGRLYPIGKTVRPTSAVLPKMLLAERSGSTRGDPAHGSIFSPHAMVGEGVKHISRSASHSTGSAGNPTDRCEQIRLGGSFVREHVFRTLVSAGDQNAYQLLRDESDSPGHPKLSQFAERQVSSGALRQHDSGVTYKEAGRHTFNVPVRPNHSIIRIVHVPRNSSASHVHSRETKCHGGPTVQNLPGTAGRMDVVPTCVPENTHIVSGSPDRLICNQMEQSIGTVRVPVPGRPGLGGGRFVDFMGRDGSLCVPTHKSHTSSLEQSHTVGCQTLPCGSHVEGPSMVPDPTIAPSGFSTRNPSEQKASKPVKSPNISHEPGRSETSRLAFGKHLLLEAGFSEKVAARAVRSHRPSSRGLYQSTMAPFRVLVSWTECGSLHCHYFSDSGLSTVLV